MIVRSRRVGIFSFWVLVAAVLCRAVPGGAAEADSLLLRAALQPRELRGCVLEDGVLRLPDPLPTQVAAEPICVEAEGFRSVTWQGETGGEIAKADDAVGGACVAFVSEAVYPFSVSRAGYYHYWQRAWISRRASWSHHVQIDDAPPMELRFGTRKEDRGDVWFWIKGERRYLKPGVHQLAVRNLHNGKRLDRWVLLPDGSEAPTATGPDATPVEAVDQGTFTSEPLHPLSVTRWQTLPVSCRGETRIEVSTGEGTFRPLSGENRTGTIGGGEVPLVVRVSMQRGASGASPSVALGPVAYLADRSQFLVLENAAMRLLLHRATGRICGLQDVRSGRRYLPDGVPATLFTIDTKSEDSPEITTHSSDDATLVEIKGGWRRATLVFALNGGELTVTVAIKLGEGWMARAAAEIRNKTERDVVGIVFPRLAQAQAGADSTDDVLCFPSMSGWLIRQPGRAGTVRNIHPIRTTIGFCDLHDDDGGLMLAPLDFPMVLTEFESKPDRSCTSTTLSLTRRDRIRAGSSGRFTAGIGVHAGDWHTAADWYREWFGETVGRPKVPDWVRDSDGWVTSHDVEAMAGLGFVHMQMWGQTGFGGCPTYYYPNPGYRSETWFADLARQWRGLGGHLGVYYHGNGISPSYILADRIYGLPVTGIPENKRPPTWDWFVRNHSYGPERTSVEKPDMSNVPEPAKAETYPNMCWQAGEWPAWLERWGVDIYLREYGLDTPYWDTLACRDAAEYNASYGLNGEGRGAMARYDFLRRIQKLGRRESQGFYQLVEGGSELLGLMAGQLESNFVKDLEVGRYTHPDQIYYIGHSNGWWTPPKTHLAACRAFYLNTKLDLIRLTPKVMEVVRCRRWLAPWLYRSRFADTLGLRIPHRQVHGALHVYRDGRGDALIATFMNWQAVGGVRAEIDVGRYLANASQVQAFVVTQTREPVSVSLASTGSGARVFEVPSEPVSAVLLLAKPVRAVPVVQASQEEARLRIRVFDPARRPRLLTARVVTEEAVLAAEPTLGDTRGQHVISNLSICRDGWGPVMFGRDLEYEDYESLVERRHADVFLTGPGVRLRARALVAPRLADPGFEASHCDASEAHSGSRSLCLPPTAQLTHFPLTLIPGHRYRVSLWVKRQEAKGDVYANVHHHLSNTSHVFGHGVKPGAWTRIETTYVMKEGMDQPHLYLYNWHGTSLPVWYDTVRIEDLGPVGE